MPTNPLREGFREVLRDPALLLIEIGWRWIFGAIAILVLWLSIFAVLGNVLVDRRFFSSSSALSVWETAQSIASTAISLGRALIRVGITAGVFLALCWIVLNSLGRHATLTRPALAPGANLRVCIAISVARAGVAFAALLAWIIAGVVAGLLGTAVSRDAVPNVGVMLVILLPAFVLIVVAWAALNWYLSLAPILAVSGNRKLAAGVWEFARGTRDRLVEVSIVSGVIRGACFVIALILSFAVAALVSNPRMLAADLIAISLLYFLCGDFVYVARLCGYAKLRSGLVPDSTQPIPETRAIQPEGLEFRRDARTGHEELTPEGPAEA
jgi:hypothetical protein